MALSIKHPEADRLARQLAQCTGLSMTEAIVVALREKLERETGRATGADLLSDLNEIAERCGQLPDVDTRSAEEILGYDEIGVPR